MMKNRLDTWEFKADQSWSHGTYFDGWLQSLLSGTYTYDGKIVVLTWKRVVITEGTDRSSVTDTSTS